MARPGDEDAVAAVVAAMYAGVCGPAGPRDWKAQERLFHPDARMMRSEIGADGAPHLKIMTRAQYSLDTAPFFAANAFYEHEINRRIDIFGAIAFVWSAYEARRDPSDAEPERRGVNSIQLHRGGDGAWRIVSMIWDNEREGVGLPAF
jgi:hypothetical protein